MALQKIKNILLFLAAALALIIVVKESLGNGDFKVFLEAAKIISSGDNPYGDWILVNKDNYAKYYYSPLWAVLLIPFNEVSNVLPNTIWLLLNCYLLYRIFILLKGYISESALTEKQYFIIVVFSVILSIRFILYNFDMLQMTIFLVWGIFESQYQAIQKKPVLAGMILAFIINVKILPLVLVPYWIYRKQLKSIFSVIIFSVIFLFLPAIIIGFKFNTELIASWWQIINPLNIEHLVESELGPHSLTALIPSLLMSTEGILDYSRNILELSLSNVNSITNTVRVLGILSVVYILSPLTLFKESSTSNQLKEISYLLLLVPLIFPHQQKYAFFMVFPAHYYLASQLILNFNTIKNSIKWKWSFSLFCLSFILMTLSSDLFLGRSLNKITQHYKLITYGTLLLMPIYFIIQSNQSKLNTKLVN